MREEGRQKGEEVRWTGKAKHLSLLPSPSVPDAMAITDFCNIGYLGGAAAVNNS
jgi:hypothetical protein